MQRRDTITKVLVIEDDEDDFIILKHYLQKINTANYDVYWGNRFEDAVNDILLNEHDIYLIDQNLGKEDGISIIETVRKAGFSKPLILLTGAGSLKIDEMAMEKGASDFIVKTEIKVDTLERSLRYALERYHQQKLILLQEKKYRSLFELSMEPLALLNENFQIIEFNNAFVNSFEFEQHPLSINLRDLFKYEFDFDAISKKVKQNGFVRGFKSEIKTDNSDKIVIISLAKLTQQEQEEGFIYQIAFHDISKIMAAQEQLQRMEKLSMTGRMARIIAHEVRNPLTNIQLALGELDELTKQNEEAQMYKEMIGRNSKRINSLIDDLLKSSRPQQLEMANTNLQKVMDEAIDFCKDRMQLQGVTCIKHYPDNLILGKWDPEKLKIAFSNIIINAVEAMTEKSNPELLISLNTKNGDPVISIRDNGRGMNEATKNQIFDPFFTERKDGLGLGMTATLNIISMHNGKIDVYSKEGEGTEFIVQIEK
jgi:signal transduction histidine kinase